MNRRKEDIPALIRSFISHYRKRIGRDVVGISDEAVTVMSRYAWPGNVRELMNVIERAMLLCRGYIITLKRSCPSSRFVGPRETPFEIFVIPTWPLMQRSRWGKRQAISFNL